MKGRYAVPVGEGFNSLVGLSRASLLLTLFLQALAFGTGTAVAQISFSAPAPSSTPIAHCQEYFNYEWNTPLDMSDREHGPLADVPTNQIRDLDGFSYANGTVTFTSTGGSPTMTLLEALPYDPVNQINAALPIGGRYGELHPIDSSRYRYFVVRMFSSKNTIAQLVWGMNLFRQAITSFDVRQGWHTYEIDMTTTPINSSSGSNLGWTQGQWQELVFIPTNSAGTLISVDSVALVSDTDCGTGTIDFTANATGGDTRYVVAIDTDTDPNNGVKSAVTGAAAGAGSLTVNGTGSAAFRLQRLFPGNHTVWGFLSSDWATLSMVNPWDMSASDDVELFSLGGINNLGFNGNALTGTVSNGDPSIWLNLRGRTIDASVFRTISVRISYAKSGGVAADALQIGYTANGTFRQKVLTNTNLSSTAISAGFAVYTANLGPGDGWTGTVSALRIDPTNNVNSIGTDFVLDFVALRESTDVVTSLAMPFVTSAPAALQINNPSVAFVQPDARGGRDFAQWVLNNSWNMNETADIDQVLNAATGEILPHNALQDEASNLSTGDFFRSTNLGGGNGDPQYPVLLHAPVGQRINTSEYLNLCFRGWNDTEPNGYNSVARVIWRDANIADDRIAYKDGDDIIITRGVGEYCLDLSQQMFARIDPPPPPGSPNPWTAIGASGSTVDVLRVDMNEVPDPFYSVMDYVHLRTDHEANSKYAIAIDAPLSQPVQLFYQSASGGAETLIGTLNGGRNTNVFEWNTSAVPAGKYFVIAKVVRFGNTFTQRSPGRIFVNPARAQDTTPPVLECERPFNGYGFETAYEIAGYALDETRLATVELFVDGAFVRSVRPDRFHLAARAAYPSYAEANNPGFQQLIDGSGLSFGAHTILLRAFDTAGNSSECQYSVTRRAGGNPAPLEYPAANGVPIAIPPFVVTPAPVPVTRVTVGAKSVVSFTVTGAGACSSVEIYAAQTADMRGAQTIFTSPGQATIVARSAAVPTFRRVSRSVKDDGVLFIRSRCASGELSSVVRLDARRVRNRRTVGRESQVIRHLRSRTRAG